MTMDHIWQRLIQELEVCLATPEGQAWAAQLTSRQLSQNS
jgi:hypothetical protein